MRVGVVEPAVALLENLPGWLWDAREG